MTIPHLHVNSKNIPLTSISTIEEHTYNTHVVILQGFGSIRNLCKKS